MATKLRIKRDDQVVVISGNSMIENAVASLKQGAQDFLVKGRVTIADLIRAIENAIEKVVLVSERQKVEERLLESQQFTQSIIETAPTVHMQSERI